MNTEKHVADIERMAHEAGMLPARSNVLTCGNRDGVTLDALSRFAALVRAQAEADARAAIDASKAQIIRNAAQGYPGNREPRELTLVERIAALDGYAADYKRWLLEAEEAAKGVRAQALEDAAQMAEQISYKYQEAESGKWPELRSDAETGANRCAAAIRALADPAP